MTAASALLLLSWMLRASGLSTPALRVASSRGYGSRRRARLHVVRRAYDDDASEPLIVAAPSEPKDAVAEKANGEADAARSGEANGARIIAETAPAYALTTRVADILANPKYEVLSAAATLLSCAAYAVGTLRGLTPDLALALGQLEKLTSVFFFLEYSFRFYSQGFAARFLLQPLSVVDLVSFLPVLLEQISGNYTFLRLLRVLRLQRLFVDVETFSRFQQALGLRSMEAGGLPFQNGDRARDETLLQLARVLSSLFTLLFVASGAIYAAEAGSNPNMTDFFDALYFGLTTLTTVGFGDITPVTPAGRLVVSASTLFGIGLVPLQLTGLAETLLKENRQREKDPRPRKMRLDVLSRRCGYCGEKAHRRDAGYCFRCGTVLPDDGDS